MEMNLRFGELREYISVIDRVSICRQETLQYENYCFIKDVPAKYDELYVYGIGRIQSEFAVDELYEKMLQAEGAVRMTNGEYMLECIEIMVSEKPRKELVGRTR